METIKKNEFSIISYFLIRAFYIGNCIYSILQITRQDSWISIIISFIVGLIPLLIFYKILNYEPNLTISEKINKVFGKSLGIIINVLLAVFITFQAGICLWNLTNFIHSQFLFQTSIVAISITFMLAILYVVNKGLKVVGRTSTVFFVFTMILFFSTLLSILGFYEIRHLEPFLESSWINIFNSSLTSLVYNILPLFTLLIIPKNNIVDNKKIGKSLLKTYLFSFFTVLVVMVSIIAIFGSPLATLYEYPEFHLLKIINVGNFFQRVESILSLQWLFDFAVSLMLYIYYVKTTLKQNFNIKDKFDKLINLIITIVIILVSTFIFPSNTIAYLFLNNIYRYICLILLLGIPIFLLIISKLKKN